MNLAFAVGSLNVVVELGAGLHVRVAVPQFSGRVLPLAVHTHWVMRLLIRKLPVRYLGGNYVGRGKPSQTFLLIYCILPEKMAEIGSSPSRMKHIFL